MTTPMQPDGPITFDMIMTLRNAARQQQGNRDKQGAAQRRLESRTASQGSSPPVSSQSPSGGGTDPSRGILANGQTPEDMMISDLQEQLDSQVEPPDITNTAAETMMRYGVIENYLLRARGELPNA